MNYELSHIATIVGAQHLGANPRVGSVMTDSRHSFDVASEPMFVAIEGAHHDGHRFIGELYQRGVRAFLVERQVDYKAWPEAGFVVADRSLVALQQLAAYHRAQYKGRVVAIAGSWGKTAVKEWLSLAAPEGVNIFSSPRSYNSQLGVALSLLMIEGDEQMAIIEAGISRRGEMERLESMIRPDVGIFTHIGSQHDENFSSLEEKMAQKGRLFASAERVFYVGGESKEVDDYFAGEAKAVAVADERALVAELYASEGYDKEAVEQKLKGAERVELRMQMAEGLGGSLVVSDCHISDLNSLTIAFDKLHEISGQREKVLIISDIRYSSLRGQRLYQRIIRMAAQEGIVRIVGVGEELIKYKNLFDASAVVAELYGSVEELLKAFRQDMIEGAAVLVCGGPLAGFERVVHHLLRKSHTTVLEVNLTKMVQNLNVYRQMLPAGHKMMAMVKASGYGHGDYEIAATLAHEGVDYLAVAFADEGVLLRQKGIRMPIVVLNADADSFGLMVSYRLEPEIYSLSSLDDFASAVSRAGEAEYPIHIKVDSGMHRLGFQMADVDALAERLDRLRSVVEVRTIFSHLATADMPEEREFVAEQQRTFKAVAEAIVEHIGYRPLLHLNNTAGMEHYASSVHDMCRLGIGLYGVGAEGVEPISRLTTRIVQLKWLAEGDTVGYGRAGRVEGPMRVATIPIGYADGLDRRCGCGAWSVSVGGQRCPIVGRVCMDSCMVDVTAVKECVEGAEVEIFGGRGGSVVEMAEMLGTIPYEIMTSVSSRVKRIFVKE